MNKKMLAIIGMTGVMLPMCMGCTKAKEVVSISLAHDKIQIDGEGATASGNIVTINVSGTYKVSGTLQEGQIRIATTTADAEVELILDGVDMTNAKEAVIYEEQAGKVKITLADGSENVLTSGEESQYEEALKAAKELDAQSGTEAAEGSTENDKTTTKVVEAATETDKTTTKVVETATENVKTTTENTGTTKETEESGTESEETTTETSDSADTLEDVQKAVIYTKNALDIEGNGALTVNGYINNGVQAKEALTIESGNLTVTAANDGIKGKKDVTVSDGTITTTTVGDGITADENVTIADGTFSVTTGEGAGETTQDTQMSGISKDRGSHVSTMEIPDDYENWFKNAKDMPEEVKEWLNSVTEMIETQQKKVSEQKTDTEQNSEQPQDDVAPQMGENGEALEGDMQPPMGKDGEMPEMPEGDMQPPMGEEGQMPQGDMTSEQKDTTEDTTNQSETEQSGTKDQSQSGRGDHLKMDMSSLEVPEELDEYLASAKDIPDDVKEWIENVENRTTKFSDRGQMENSDKDSNGENTVSQKGIKAGTTVTIKGGTFQLDTADDGVHSGDQIVVEDGTLEIASGDDGIHADNALTVNGGTIKVTQAYEGLEATQITVNDGTIHVTSSDDGINVGGGSSDGFGMRGGMPGTNTQNAEESEEQEAETTEDETNELEPTITINGGNIYINANGDGIDSNQDLLITGGEIYVDGPANGGNSAIDVGTENGGIAKITGGHVIGIGSAEMAEPIDSSSSQYAFLYAFDNDVEAGTEISVSDADGNVLETITTVKNCNSVILSSDSLQEGATYTLTAGDQSGEITLEEVYTSNSTSRMGGLGKRNPAQ